MSSSPNGPALSLVLTSNSGVVGVAAGQVGQGAAGLEEPDVSAVADGEVAEGLGDVALANADGAVEDHDSPACSQRSAARSRIWAAAASGTR